MRDLPDLRTEQKLARAADGCAELIVNEDEPPLQIELGDPDGVLLENAADSGFIGLQIREEVAHLILALTCP